MATIPSDRAIVRISYLAETTDGFPHYLNYFKSHTLIAFKHPSELALVYYEMDSDAVSDIEVIARQDNGQPVVITAYERGPDGKFVAKSEGR